MTTTRGACTGKPGHTFTGRELRQLGRGFTPFYTSGHACIVREMRLEAGQMQAGAGLTRASRVYDQFGHFGCRRSPPNVRIDLPGGGWPAWERPGRIAGGPLAQW